MLEISNMSHVYAQKQALDTVSFTLHKGVTALLGRNGAGKSTLMKILATLLNPTTGELLLNGAEVSHVIQKMRDISVYLPQDMVYPAYLTGKEYVHYLLALKGKDTSSVEAWMKKLGLSAALDTRLAKYSGGMRQRTALAYTLACDAELLLLDEPTQGLDPWERLRFNKYIAAVSSDKSILFSTHIISDVEAIASRIIILDQGRIIYDGWIDELYQTYQVPTWIIQSTDALQDAGKYVVSNIKRVSHSCLEIRGIGETVPQGAEFVQPDLEDIYLWLTHREK